MTKFAVSPKRFQNAMGGSPGKYGIGRLTVRERASRTVKPDFYRPLPTKSCTSAGTSVRQTTLVPRLWKAFSTQPPQMSLLG